MQVHYWTTDIDRIMAFYTQALGFNLDYAQPDGGPYDFCILSLADQTVMFGIPPTTLIKKARNDKALMEEVNGRIGQGGALSVYFEVEDVDAHYETAAAKQAQILEPLWQTPWGLSQYSVQDPDGNLLTFHNK